MCVTTGTVVLATSEVHSCDHQYRSAKFDVVYTDFGRLIRCLRTSRYVGNRRARRHTAMWTLVVSEERGQGCSFLLV